MQWNEIVGHDDNINALKAMLENGRVPHAMLFAGPEGVGKAAVANVFAAGLLCTGGGLKPCGDCPSCRRAQNMSHPDLVAVSPDGASIKIDQVRELQREIALTPYYGQRRVGIIDAAETMTTQAANSLLKTLEEPVGNTVFILLTSARQQLLDTIISRCRVLTFHALPNDVLSRALVGRGISSEQADAAARISGGRMGAALSLASEGGLAARDQAAEIVMALPNWSLKDVWDTAALFDKLDRQQALVLYKYMTLVLRDILIYLALQDNKLEFNVDIAGRLATAARNWSEQNLLVALEAVETARKALAANANIRLTSEALLIKLRDAAGEE